MVNTLDQKLIDVLADKVFVLTKDSRFIKLNKDGNYVIKVAVGSSKSITETQEVNNLLENKQIEIISETIEDK